MGYQSFRELRVRQEEKKLAVETYNLTVSGGLSKDSILLRQVDRDSNPDTSCIKVPGMETRSTEL